MLEVPRSGGEVFMGGPRLRWRGSFHREVPRSGGEVLPIFTKDGFIIMSYYIIDSVIKHYF